MNEVVTVISADTGKCLDYCVMSKHCDACNYWKDKKNTESNKYDNFMATHKCYINHIRSAGSMEASGLKEYFMTSIKTNKLRYIYYIGDGDSKSYNDIYQGDPYEGIVANKLECIGHIQKRVGTRLRKLMASNTKTILSDVKKLSGQGRLTEKIINNLQNYYDIAIRSTCHENVYSLKVAIGAVLYHCSEASSEEAGHHFWPTGEDLWYKYHANKDTYRPKLGLPIAIRKFIKPSFMELSDERLLAK